MAGQTPQERVMAQITRDGPVAPLEIEDLREAVGWDRSEGTYEQIVAAHYAHYTVRDEHSRLIGYMSVLSDGVADAFLLDLAIHPQHQHKGIGTRLVRTAIRDLKAAGIRCVQVTFGDDLEPFCARCGFRIFRGGIIDFHDMEWNGEGQRPLEADG